MSEKEGGGILLRTRTRSLSEPPHNLQVVNEIHFYPKQYAQKTISKVAPGAPGPPRGAGARAGGPPGPEFVKYEG